jgi:N-acetyl-gamma-glutamyl-phosphate reductase
LQGIVSLTFEALAPEALAERADVLFLALPHTKSMGPVASCMKAGKRVIDLSADFRLKDARTYETWYQTTHAHPDLIGSAVYGLPELHRSAIAQAWLQNGGRRSIASSSMSARTVMRMNGRWSMAAASTAM